MGRNQGKRRPFGEGVSRKGQKKLKLRNEAMAKAREILGNVEDGERPEEEEDTAAQESNNRGGYETVMKKSERYEAFYRTQKLIPDDEFEEFMEILKRPLPITFRITGYKGEAQEILNIIKGKFFQEVLDIELNGERVPPPAPLSWYPGELAWQLNIAKSDIRKVEALKKLHKFMISEQEGGHITRQEAVSMIPPLLLDVKPHHRVMDLCAAPGSKTAQIIEQLHGATGFGIPEGFVVANDADNKRCYLLVHQAKRLQSPSGLIMNADAAFLPNMKDIPSAPDARPGNIQYDRVLCDVPCSGDGTLRKNLDIWKKWTPQNGTNLHGLQRRILWRGLEVLVVGGRLVYSTCSLNPLEDEAVVAAALRSGQGSVRLVDVDGDLPGLKYCKGVVDWKVLSKAFDIYSSFSEVAEEYKKSITTSMFPPTVEEQKWMHLDRCMRILPHHQNTGGFFVAVLEKVAECPRLHDFLAANGADSKDNTPVGMFEDKSTEGEENGNAPELKPELKPVDTVEDNGENGSEVKRPYSPPPNVKVKNSAFIEDPFIFMTWEKDRELLENLKSFYGFDDTFPFEQLFCRCEKGPRRSLYLVTKSAKEAVVNNMTKIKFINMGVRVFERQDNKDPSVVCPFRLTQEGVPMVLPYLNRRKIPVTDTDIALLLTRDEDSVRNGDFSEVAKPAIEAECNVAGSVAWVFTPRPDSRIQCELVLAGWMGRTTGRVYIHRNQRVHFLQLLGIEWEGIIEVGPNRKDKIKMNKAEKRKEARMKKRAERDTKREDEGNGEDSKGVEKEEDKEVNDDKFEDIEAEENGNDQNCDSE